MIYRISNGKADSIAIPGEELRGRESISVDGYVCGIAVFCDPDVRVSVDGREPHPIRRNADGTFGIQNYGKTALEDSTLPVHRRCCDTSRSQCESVCRESGRSAASGYTLFPDVFGDSLSRASQFDITFESEDETSHLLIQHDGSHTLPITRTDCESHADGLVFRYLGTRLDQFEQRAADLEDRLRAIEEGVGSVESVFGARLVGAVNVIDYENVKDAVACDGSDDIWIYVDAFLGESLEELKTIAAHETLHVLVDKNRFARDSEVRELFAGLRGHDEFSPERFSIVLSGIAPPREPEQCLENGAFFAFINERNFIEGMKGGHSQDTVEDFSVSFMHSLMFIDRFEQNLNRPVLFSAAAGGARSLTDRERDFVVDSYLNAIGTFINAIDSKCENSATTRAFLQKKLSILTSPEEGREPQS
jgi:hypothetical protein